MVNLPGADILIPLFKESIFAGVFLIIFIIYLKNIEKDKQHARETTSIMGEKLDGIQMSITIILEKLKRIELRQDNLEEELTETQHAIKTLEVVLKERLR